MPVTDWLERRLSPRGARRLVDAALVGSLASAVVVGLFTGLPAVAIGLLAVGSVALEGVVSRAARRQLVEAATETSVAPDDALEALVANLADRMAVPTPRIVLEDGVGVGVTVLQDRRRPVLLLSHPLVDALEEPALRGVIAHELTHLDSHIGPFDSRDAVAHVVGATVLWIAVARHLPLFLAMLALAVYVFAGVFRETALPQLYYLGASLGIVLLPLALVALAHRLQERQADDRAVAVTSARDFCRGLVTVARSNDDESMPADLLGSTPAGHQRGLLERMTALHPPLSRRLARYGFTVGELEEA